MSSVSSRTSGIIALHELPWSCLFQKRSFSSCKILRAEMPSSRQRWAAACRCIFSAGTFLAQNGDLWGGFGGLKLVKEKRFNTEGTKTTKDHREELRSELRETRNSARVACRI